MSDIVKLIKFIILKKSRECSVSIVTGYGLGFDSRQYKIFLFSTTSRQNLGSTQPLMGAMDFSPGVKQQGRDVDHSSPSCAEVKKGGAISPLPNISLWHSA
jgi:hypothetical protein